jgi:general secretion pathway protein F
MPKFRYRALTQSGEVVSGLISASTAAEVARRIDYLGLVAIDDVVEHNAERMSRLDLTFGRRASQEDVTTFTLDLSLLLKAGARLNEALELLATDTEMGRLRSTVNEIRSSVVSGETFADALAHHPALFPSIYVALVRVGESSGKLEQILNLLARERTRSEALRRKLADALRYPAFLLFAAVCVLIFFLTFVLPQFAAVLRDFGAKIDPLAQSFFQLSEFVTAHTSSFGTAAALLLAGGLVAGRQSKVRMAAFSQFARLPLLRTLCEFHRTALFCRNLDVLLTAAVPMTTTLRILADMMRTMGDAVVWTTVVEQVRHGGKLSEAIAETGKFPAMSVRMLRLGEESGQLPELAARVAEFYETKLQRGLERLVGLIGPLSIITISIVIGGLIISVMTSLLSVSQLVG